MGFINSNKNKKKEMVHHFNYGMFYIEIINFIL